VDYIRSNTSADNPKHTTKASAAGTTHRRGAAQLVVRYRVANDSHRHEREACGRFAWALLRLHRAGGTGITSLENPAPRLSHYVYGLRRDGLAIETTYEDHGGDFAGRHGRYRLVTPIEVVEVIEPQQGANR
jgi:hypothetical protein